MSPAGTPAASPWPLALAALLALAVHAAALWGVRFTVFSEPADEPVTSFEVAFVERPGGEPPPPAPEPIETLPPTAPEPEPPPVVAAPKPAAPAPKPAPPVAAPPPAALPPAPPEPATPLPRVGDLLSSGLQMAHLENQPQPAAGQAREKYLDPATLTTVERFYVQSWVRKVEQVGTLNFPEEARRRELTGRLTLDVALRANGTVESIRLVRSSGHRVLDDAAFRIVQLAAPYAAFPAELRNQYEVLHIVRTWVFDQGSRLRGQ